MKNLLFKIWIWKFELKVSKNADDEKFEWLCKYLFQYADKTQDLLASTKEFKYLSLNSYKKNELTINVGPKVERTEINGGFDNERIRS